MVEISGEVQTRPARFELLDYLRFVAAAMVVTMHYLVNGIANGKVTGLSPNDWATPWAKYGYLGVSLFFIISGFVITKSADGKTARRFAVGRFVRLYPAYWVALIFTSAVAWSFARGTSMEVTPKQIAVNFSMIATKLGEPHVDGAYWTLTWELQFYLLIFLVLFFGLGRHLDLLFPAWTVGMTAATLAFPAQAESHMWTGGYFFLFAGGALIASIRDKGPTWWRVAALVLAWVMAVRYAMKEAAEFLDHKGIEQSPVVTAVIVSLFFLAVLSMCMPQIAELRLPYARTVGALTYPVYLLHAHFGYIVLSRLATDSTKWAIYPLLVVTLTTLAWALHKAVETGPVLRWFTRTFDRTLGALIEAVQPASWRHPSPRPARDHKDDPADTVQARRAGTST